MRRNVVKEKLKAGVASVGSWLSLGSSVAAITMARAGFDWLLIDTEHGQIGYKDMLHCIQAICVSACIPFVRVAWNDPMLIKRALDAGALGILVPMVCTPEEAEAAARAALFPPQGIRSAGGGLASRLHGADYFQRANQEICVLVQIEHINAVKRAREILSVDGVDGGFVGPNDLAASMGLLNTNFREHPDWQSAVEHVLDAARDVGKAVGIHCTNASDAVMRLEQGFQFVALSSELRFIAAGATEAIQQIPHELWKPNVG